MTDKGYTVQINSASKEMFAFTLHDEIMPAIDVFASKASIMLTNGNDGSVSLTPSQFRGLLRMAKEITGESREPRQSIDEVSPQQWDEYNRATMLTKEGF